MPIEDLDEVDGWDIYVLPHYSSMSGVCVLDHFAMRGRCPCGNEFVIDEKPPGALECGCEYSEQLLARCREHFAAWGRRKKGGR